MINSDSILLDVQLLHPQYMCGSAILIIIFLILLLFIIRKYLKKKNKSTLIGVLFSIIIIIFACIFEVYLYLDYQYELHYDILEYSIELNSISNENEIVYFPISENRGLQESLKIKSGSGKLSIFDSEYGHALKINFSGKIKIEGKIDTTSGIGKHDLTMVNQTKKWHSIEYWIFYKPSNSFNYNCSFKLKLFHESLDWWETHYCEGFLSEGWNTYWGTEGAES